MGPQGFLHTLYVLSHTPSPSFHEVRISRCPKLHASAYAEDPRWEAHWRHFLELMEQLSQRLGLYPLSLLLPRSAIPQSFTFSYLSSHEQPKPISNKQPKREPCLFPLIPSQLSVTPPLFPGSRAAIIHYPTSSSVPAHSQGAPHSTSWTAIPQTERFLSHFPQCL